MSSARRTMEGWALLSSFRGDSAKELEDAFCLEKRKAHEGSQCLAALGLGSVQVLLGAKLWLGSQQLAALALAQVALLYGLVALASVWPMVFTTLKPCIHGALLIGGAAQSSFLSNWANVATCAAIGSPRFWLVQLASWRAPQAVMHATAFPEAAGALIYGAAAVLMLLGNPERCAATLGSCPAAGPHFASLAASLSRATSIFSTRLHLPGPPAVASTPLLSCVALATGAELFSLCAVLHVSWELQRRARLAYACGQGDVTQEWLLERSARSMVVMALELAAVGLVCWQVAELWFFLQ